MLGGRGYIESNGAPQILRDARVLRILEGPTETLYAHLGASMAQPAGAVHGFLAETLGRPALAAELAALVARLRGAMGGSRLFGSQAALSQWLDYRIGELAARACLVGAAEQRQQDGLGDPQLASDAVVWARRRFSALGHELVAEMAANRPHSSSDALVALIGGYAAQIGDVDQQLPGESQGADALLRRDAAYAGQAPALRQQRAPAAPLAVVATAAASAAASSATQAIVHECIMNWLRSEPLRQGVEFDADTPFTDLGMDSLATASISADLEERVGMTILPELLFDYGSVSKLAAHIDSRATAPTSSTVEAAG